MTNLNMKPWELSNYTIPQLMCLMAENPREQERITDFSQYKAMLDRQKQEEKEWAVRL